MKIILDVIEKLFQFQVLGQKTITAANFQILLKKLFQFEVLGQKTK